MAQSIRPSICPIVAGLVFGALLGTRLAAQPADLGDAPAPYPTLLAEGGARHVVDPNLYLGDCVDVEPDGQPSMAALGDDGSSGPSYGPCALSNDERGIVFAVAGTVFRGSSASFEVTASGPCTLSAWIDFDADGDWLDATDDLLPGGLPIAAGVTTVSFSVPAGAVLGQSVGRFRCTTAGAVGVTGDAPDGEVEDHLVNILDQGFDYGDAPDSYGTSAAANGARHALGTNVFLGSCVDAEAMASPSPGADGDDSNLGSSAAGPAGCTPQHTRERRRGRRRVRLRPVDRPAGLGRSDGKRTLRPFGLR